MKPARRDTAELGQEAIAQYEQYTREVELRPPHKHEDADSGIELAWVDGRVHVVSVDQNSRAEKAGVFVGDEILEISGISIDAQYTAEALNELVSSCDTVKLVVKDRPSTPITIRRADKRQPLGIGYASGMVKAVTPGSPAAEHKLPQGKAIVEVNGKCVMGRSDKDIMRKINRARTSSVQLTLMEGALYQELSRAMSPKTRRRNESSPLDVLSRSFDSLRLHGGGQ